MSIGIFFFYKNFQNLKKKEPKGRKYLEKDRKPFPFIPINGIMRKFYVALSFPCQKSRVRKQNRKEKLAER